MLLFHLSMINIFIKWTSKTVLLETQIHTRAKVFINITALVLHFRFRKMQWVLRRHLRWRVYVLSSQFPVLIFVKETVDDYNASIRCNSSRNQGHHGNICWLCPASSRNKACSSRWYKLSTAFSLDTVHSLHVSL